MGRQLDFQKRFLTTVDHWKQPASHPRIHLVGKGSWKYQEVGKVHSSWKNLIAVRKRTLIIITHLLMNIT